MIVLGLLIADGLGIVGLLAWKRYFKKPVEKTNFSGLKEYRTKTGMSLYCLQGGGQRKQTKVDRYGTVS